MAAESRKKTTRSDALGERGGNMVTFNGDDEILRFSCASCEFKEHIDIDPEKAEDLKKLGKWLLTHSKRGGKYECIPTDFDSKCIKFHELYANLPIEKRDDVCVVIDDEPISWKLARGYIVAKAQISQKIIGVLSELREI